MGNCFCNLGDLWHRTGRQVQECFPCLLRKVFNQFQNRVFRGLTHFF